MIITGGVFLLPFRSSHRKAAPAYIVMLALKHFPKSLNQGGIPSNRVM
jgi:hypothetical protein